MNTSASRWDDDVLAQLLAMASAHGRASQDFDPAAPPLAALDLDNTCINTDISEQALTVLGARTRRDLLGEYDRIYSKEGRRRAYERCAELIGEGQGDAQLNALAQELRAAGYVATRPAIQTIIDALHAEGWHVWLVSASLEPLVRAAAAWLDIPAERALGIRLALAPDDLTYLPQSLSPLTYQQGKVDAIDRFIGRRPTFAAGDSDSDLAMMEAATHALVIDRGEPGLRASAARRKWWVQGGWSCQARLGLQPASASP